MHPQSLESVRVSRLRVLGLLLATVTVGFALRLSALTIPTVDGPSWSGGVTTIYAAWFFDGTYGASLTEAERASGDAYVPVDEWANLYGASTSTTATITVGTYMGSGYGDIGSPYTVGDPPIALSPVDRAHDGGAWNISQAENLDAPYENDDGHILLEIPVGQSGTWEVYVGANRQANLQRRPTITGFTGTVTQSDSRSDYQYGNAELGIMNDTTWQGSVVTGSGAVISLDILPPQYYSSMIDNVYVWLRPVAVPEPSTAVLLLVFGGVGLCARRRRRA
jgi:hypothetical protein